MKKTMVFENETAYDNWFDVNEEKEGGHDFLENRVVIIKETRTINGKKFKGFSADSTIECKNIRTAIKRFVKELNSNGFEVSVDDFECSFNGENLYDLTGSGMVVEIEEIDDGRYYVNYMCYQDEDEEEIETEETTEETEATETEMETATDTETAETEETTEKNVIEIVNENDYAKLERELIEPVDNHIEVIKKFKEKADLNSSYGDATEPLTIYQFERLTKTLYKSLFKAIGLEETRRIPIIISNNMVYFNYNGTQYKYNPAQCKVYKKDGRKYQRINWKDFTDDNSPTDQKQARGRSPPFTPDMRSTTIQ